MRVLRAAVKPKCIGRGGTHFPLRLLRTIRTGSYAASKVSPETTRKKEEKKVMARNKLSLEQQLKGVKAAINSKKTPPQLRDGLRRREAWLRDQISTEPKSKKKKRGPVFFLR
jgi:hypothetical protein